MPSDKDLAQIHRQIVYLLKRSPPSYCNVITKKDPTFQSLEYFTTVFEFLSLKSVLLEGAGLVDAYLRSLQTPLKSVTVCALRPSRKPFEESLIGLQIGVVSCGRSV